MRVFRFIILIYRHLIKETIDKLEENMPDIEEVDKFIEDFKKSRQENSANFVSSTKCTLMTVQILKFDPIKLIIPVLHCKFIHEVLHK